MKKEKKAKRRLQDQVEGRVVQNGSPEPESMVKQTPADHLRALNGKFIGFRRVLLGWEGGTCERGQRLKGVISCMGTSRVGRGEHV